MRRNTMMREIVKIDEDKCDGCGLCVPACAEGAIKIVDGKARLLADNLCDGLGACLGHCPQDAILIEKRPAEEFDEGAVEQHLKTQGGTPSNGHGHGHGHGHGSHSGGGCPSAKVMDFTSGGGCPSSRVMSSAPVKASVAEAGSRQSQLRQWPVQLHLVPPTAPFLKGADVLLAADCVPFAYADFHKDFLKDKALLIACPKLDNTEPYLAKLTTMIQQSDIKSLTVLHMEVPCCTGLIHIARQAVEASGKEVRFESVRIGLQGDVK
jgi:NAD-dependent dihydropyrimidine dehydrogenase PreA subunit